ncbi:Cell surface protein [Pediococcus damnosus]|uniref:DUF7601 domain-containing protein n=1 Tax=Pediococcus damnosus TaxID=51663 RepID=UPI00078E1F9B|nr:collagen-binding domain-containing protein [Pediococcus damnosus]AMV69778.1 Cell surface protein [Pediococcus damnosus]
MKFSGLKENVKFGSLSFLAPVENEKVESEDSSATEKESETSKEESQSSGSTESEDNDDADTDVDQNSRARTNSDTGSATEKATRAVTEIPLPEFPDRSGNPLGVAANFHIFAENFARGGNAHTSGNIAVNSLTNVSEIGNEGRDTRWQETSYVKAYDGRRDRLTFRAAVFGNEHSLTDINNGAQTFLTGGPLGTGRVSYQYNNSGDNITGAAINGNWIDVTDTLTTLKQTRDNLVNTPYAIDFDDTRYLTEDSNGLTLNFEDEAVQNTFVIKVSNSQIAGKTLNIKLRDEQNVIFVATPDKDSGALGSAHMHVYVDGELIGPDPEAGKGTRYNYSILWAIPEGSEEVNLVGNMFFGSVLAPSQTVQSYTNFNGTIVADTYLGSSAETHSWTYNPTTEVEPEPEETQLVVKKTVEGSDDDKNKEFKFVITRLDEENFDGTLKMKINGQGEEINLKFTDGKSEEITLKHGQYVSLVVPNGSRFSINETEAHGASTGIEIDGNAVESDNRETGPVQMGEADKGQSHIVDYTNKFEEEPETKDLQIKKTVTGDVPHGTKFKFNLSIDPKKAGTYKYTAGDGSEQDITFDEDGKSTSSIELEADQTATIKGLPKDAKVTITEIDADGYKTTIKHENNGAEEKKEITIDFTTINSNSTSVVFNNHLTKPNMPVTGGIGNLIFILVGLLVVAVGGYLLYKNRRGNVNG